MVCEWRLSSATYRHSSTGEYLRSSMCCSTPARTLPTARPSPPPPWRKPAQMPCTRFPKSDLLGRPAPCQAVPAKLQDDCAKSLPYLSPATSNAWISLFAIEADATRQASFTRASGAATFPSAPRSKSPKAYMSPPRRLRFCRSPRGQALPRPSCSPPNSAEASRYTSLPQRCSKHCKPWSATSSSPQLEAGDRSSTSIRF